MRKILMIFAALLIWAGAAAQTPVEDLIVRYGDMKGVKDFIAKGARMNLVRGFLGNYGLAPIADEVDQLYVMKLGNASYQVREEFHTDFMAAVKTYEYYGKTEGKNGVVDVYVLISGPDTVSELVVYNPEIYVLNSLGGNFSVSSLLSLVNK